MGQNQRIESLTIVLREYKKEKLVFNLRDINFIQKIDRNVFVFINKNRNQNLFSRHITTTRDLIEKQDLQNHFYMNTRIIVSYHFIHSIISAYNSTNERLIKFKSEGLNIGRNEYLKLQQGYADYIFKS